VDSLHQRIIGTVKSGSRNTKQTVPKNQVTMAIADKTQELFEKFVEWDKKLIKKFQDKFKISDYKMLCISFAKGFIIGAILL